MITRLMSLLANSADSLIIIFVLLWVLPQASHLAIFRNIEDGFRDPLASTLHVINLAVLVSGVIVGQVLAVAACSTARGGRGSSLGHALRLAFGRPSVFGVALLGSIGWLIGGILFVVPGIFAALTSAVVIAALLDSGQPNSAFRWSSLKGTWGQVLGASVVLTGAALAFAVLLLIVAAALRLVIGDALEVLPVGQILAAVAASVVAGTVAALGVEIYHSGVRAQVTGAEFE